MERAENSKPYESLSKGVSKPFLLFRDSMTELIFNPKRLQVFWDVKKARSEITKVTILDLVFK